MRLAVFASGGGSNFQAIVEASRKGDLDADVALCVTNNPQAGVLQRADALGVKAEQIEPDGATARKSEPIHKLLTRNDVTHIALAGYLKKIPATLISAYSGRIVNIHPALLPCFGGKGMYGANVHQAVIESGVQWTGVTVHFVDETYDTGPILLQHAVGVHPADTAESLAKRVLWFEHRVYPAALQLLAENRVITSNKRVQITGSRPHFPLYEPDSPQDFPTSS